MEENEGEEQRRRYRAVMERMSRITRDDVLRTALITLEDMKNKKQLLVQEYAGTAAIAGESGTEEGKYLQKIYDEDVEKLDLAIQGIEEIINKLSN